MDDKNDLDLYMKEMYLASFGKRILASLIDGVILAGVALLLYYIITHEFSSRILLKHSLIIITINVLYEILLTYFFGMTIGKKVMKIKVVSNINNKISLKQAVLRCVYKDLSGYILYIGFLWMLKNEYSQTWHDILANTLVINNDAEEEITEYIINNPWQVSNKHRLIRVFVLILTFLICSYTNLNKFVNKMGNFGIEEVYSTSFNEAFLNTKLFDIDNDNDDEIITLSEKNKGLSMNIYDWKDSELKKIDSFTLEEKQTSIDDWEVADLDDDGMFEVVVVVKEDHVLEIRVYRGINNEFQCVKTEAKHCNIEVVKDKEGKKHIACYYYYSGKIISYSFLNGELVKDYDAEVSIKNGWFIGADFDGDNIDELYLLKDKKYKRGNVKGMFFKLTENDNSIVETNEGEIDLKSNVYRGRLDRHIPHNFIVDDINGDGKDNIVFETTSEWGLAPWLNTITYKDDKWIKIYSGGSFKRTRNYEDLCLLGKGDINGDGIEELLMGGDLEIAYRDELYGEPLDNNIYFYQINPLEFKLNSFFQILDSPIRKIFPIFK